MAGMLYLPRLFVYHCAAEKGSVQSETFKVMERRLLRAIINLAMIATWIIGLSVLPVRGGDTIKARWPLPTGATISITRAERSFLVGSSYSIFSHSSSVPSQGQIRTGRQCKLEDTRLS